MIQFENRLLTAKDKLDALLKSVSEGILITDMHGIIIEAGQQMTKTLGLTSSRDITGKSLLEFIALRDRTGVQSKMQQCLENEDTSSQEYALIHLKRGEFTGKLKFNVLKDSAGNPAGFVVSLTEADKPEKEHKASWLNEDTYRRIVETTDQGIRITDPHGKTIYVNQKMAGMLGYQREEMIGAKGLDFAEIGRRQSGYTVRCHADGCSSIEREFKFYRKDGEAIWMNIVASPLFDSRGRYTGNLMMHTDITERKLLEIALAKAKDELEDKVEERTAELLKAKEQLEFYTKEIIRVQEEERKRIALELHDETAQNLALLTLEIDSILKGKEELPESVISRLQKLREDTDHAQKEVRRFSHELRPGVLDYLGLEAALEGLAEDTNEKGALKVDFKVKGEGSRLPDDVELALFRIAQEALSNCQKHAQASRASITLQFFSRKIKLTISDNGVGFNVNTDAPAAVKRRRLGLIGMRERSGLIGARLNIRSYIRKGTTISVEVGSRDSLDAR